MTTLKSALTVISDVVFEVLLASTLIAGIFLTLVILMKEGYL